MSWFSDFRSKLVTAVGHSRVYVGVAPTSATMPYQVYSRISSAHEHHLRAASGVAFQTVQVDTYDDDHVTAHAQAELIRAGFDGFRGVMGNSSVRMCHLDSERDELIPPTDASQVGRHRISMDFNLALFESVPTFA